ncbi:gustatory and odorant receptor 22 [Halyomorpha halys]|uniref:gustatory and odorant receptor 22 n=1 Tax=Halyomorpha halys TaxID=286706 RepID=UPI0034D1EE9B|nr:Gustatory receptor 1 [Halyomorpha halys]
MKRELTLSVYQHFYTEGSHRPPLSEVTVPRAEKKKRAQVRSAYYGQFRPVLLILRIFGRYTIQLNEKGEWEGKRISPSALYCLINYGLQTYVAVIVCFRRVQALVDSQSNYDEFIFSIHILAYLNIHFHVPFTYWLQNSRMAHYLNLWNDFQLNWEATFGEKLELMYKRTVLIYVAVIIPAVVLFLVFEQYSTLHDPWLYFLPYFFTIVSTALVLVLWSLTCIELKRLSEDVSLKLIASLETKPNKWLLKRWRHLWLDLRQLTMSLGTDLSAVLMSIMLTFSTTFLLGLYNGLVQLISYDISWKAIGYLCASTFSLAIVFTICDAGHRATSAVASCTLTAVLKAKISMVNAEVRHEIFLILESIKAGAPDIQLGGFVTLNRPLVVSLISNTLTYLIVLLQFKVNEEENES